MGNHPREQALITQVGTIDLIIPCARGWHFDFSDCSASARLFSENNTSEDKIFVCGYSIRELKSIQLNTFRRN